MVWTKAYCRLQRVYKLHATLRCRQYMHEQGFAQELVHLQLEDLQKLPSPVPSSYLETFSSMSCLDMNENMVALS